jgi:hypothetical protein
MGLFSKTPKLLIFMGKLEGADVILQVGTEKAKNLATLLLYGLTKGAQDFRDIPPKLIKMIPPEDWCDEPFDDRSIAQAGNGADNPFTLYVEKQYGKKVAEDVLRQGHMSIYKSNKDGYVLFYLKMP